MAKMPKTITIPIPDPQPNKDWKVDYDDNIIFEFNANFNDFKVDHPDYFTPHVKRGPRQEGDCFRCKATTHKKRVVFEYEPDDIEPAVDSHTILIGN